MGRAGLAVVAHVVHVQAQPVARAVHVETAVVAGFQHAVQRTFQELQVQHALRQHAQGGLMAVVETAAGRGGLGGGVLGRHRQVVQRALRAAVAAVHGKGPGDVAGIAVDFAARVDQDQVTVAQHGLAGRVVQHAGVRARCDDAVVGHRLRAMAAEFVQQFGLDLVFAHAGAGDAHGAHVGARGNLGRPPHCGNFAGVLDQPHFGQQGPDVLLAGGGSMAATAGLARRGQPAVQAAVVALVAGQGRVQGGVVLQQRGHQLVQRIERMGVVKAEMRRRRLGAETLALPDFMLDVAWAAEEHRAVGRSRDQHQPGAGFGEPGQVEKIAVMPIGVFGVSVASGFRCGRQDRNAASVGAHLLHQALAPRGVRGDVFGRQAHGGVGREPRQGDDAVYFTCHPSDTTPRAGHAESAGPLRASCYNRGSVIGE